MTQQDINKVQQELDARTTQNELDQDFKTILNAHLITRRDLLKRVKAELSKLDLAPTMMSRRCVYLGDVMRVMDRLILEAEMPRGSVKD